VRVLLVTGNFGDGLCGVGDYTWGLARRLGEICEVGVLHISAPGPARAPLALPSNLLPRSIRFMSAHTASLWNYPNLAAPILRFDPDVVHIEYPSRAYGATLGVVLMPLLFRLQTTRSAPFVVTIHEYCGAHPLRKAVVRAMARRAKRVIVVSQDTKAALTAAGIGAAKIAVIPDGCVFEGIGASATDAYMSSVLDSVAPPGLGEEVKQAEPPPHEQEPSGEVKQDDVSANDQAHSHDEEHGDGLVREHFDVGRMPDSVFHYGLVTPGKGLEDLIDAVALVRRAVPSVRLYLAAPLSHDEQYHRQILERIKAAGIEDAVVLLGQLSPAALAHVARRMVVAVFPFTDGFSTRRSSVISMLAFPTPIVTTAGEEACPLVTVPPRDVRALADRIAAVLLFTRSCATSLDIRRVLEAQAEMAAAYSFAGIAKRHVELYGQMLGLAPTGASASG